tara:strand:+ start:659 stop:847 length:189 start_codon:yes stop_codon:yes gene_type:complete
MDSNAVVGGLFGLMGVILLVAVSGQIALWSKLISLQERCFTDLNDVHSELLQHQSDHAIDGS